MNRFNWTHAGSSHRENCPAKRGLAEAAVSAYPQTDAPVRPLVRPRINLSRLKKCPVCDAVNARANAECFVCGWHGRFEVRPKVVARALYALIDICPELADAMAYPQAKRAHLWRELRSFWFRFVHRFSTARRS